MKKISALTLYASLSLLLGSCASTNSLRSQGGTYLESVKINFDAGEKAVQSEEYDKAIEYFLFVKNKYPFSMYSSLSDLRLADVKFLQKKWLDAASGYEVFIRLHPRHAEVPYAMFRVGLSYFYAIPKDFFLLPPATSREQSFTKEALAAIERFIVQYPSSQYVEEAKEKRILLFSYLAQHNMHIADYYRRRHKYDAAVARLLEVEALYPQTKESAQALYLAAEIILDELKDEERAVELLRGIVESKPAGEYVEKAQKKLHQLGR